MVEQHQVRAAGSRHTHNLVELSVPHQGGWIRLCAALHHRCRHLRACAPRQFLKLRQRRGKIEIAARADVGRRPRNLRRLRPHCRGLAGPPRRCGQPPPLSGELHRDQHGELLPRICVRQGTSRARRLRLCFHKAHLCPLVLVVSGLGMSVCLQRLAQSPATPATSLTTPATPLAPPCARASGLASVRPSACGPTLPLTTVEIACLKISCSCALFSSSTEYLSKDRILPVSLTPLTR